MAAFIIGSSLAWPLGTAEDAGPGPVPQPCCLGCDHTLLLSNLHPQSPSQQFLSRSQLCLICSSTPITSPDILFSVSPCPRIKPPLSKANNVLQKASPHSPVSVLFQPSRTFHSAVLNFPQYLQWSMFSLSSELPSIRFLLPRPFFTNALACHLLESLGRTFYWLC